jgi:hypothetical protein
MPDPVVQTKPGPISLIEQRLIEERLSIADLSRKTGAGFPLLLSVIYGGYPDPALRKKLVGILGDEEGALFPRAAVGRASVRDGAMLELSPEEWLRFFGLVPFVPGEGQETLKRVAAGSAALAAYEERRLTEVFQGQVRQGKKTNRRSMVSLADYPDGKTYLFQRIRGQYHLPSGKRVLGYPEAERAIEAEGAKVRRVARTSPAVAGAIPPIEIADFFRVYAIYRREMKGYAEDLVEWLTFQERRHEMMRREMMAQEGRTEADGLPILADLVLADMRRLMRRLRLSSTIEEGSPAPEADARRTRKGWVPITRDVLARDPSSMRNTAGYIIVAVLPDERLYWLRAIDRRGVLRPDGSERIPTRQFLSEMLDHKQKAFLARARFLTPEELDQIEETALEAIDGYRRTRHGQRTGKVPGVDAVRPTRPSWEALAARYNLTSEWRPSWFEA